MRPVGTARLGLLGGTFDPVHRGHLAAARAARIALGLDHVWLMPAPLPSHRATPGASGWHRFAMAAMAVEDEDGLGVTDIELARSGLTYTWDTLEALTAAGLAATQLYFITGADAFSAIATWHRYPDLLDRAHFVVVTRPGHDVVPARDWPAEVQARLETPGTSSAPGRGDITDVPRVWLVEAGTPDVSSSQIRSRVRGGEDVGPLVLPRVAAHIRRHGLYDAPPAARTLHGEQ